MPSCPNCHNETWNLECEVCNTKIPYDQELGALVEVPQVDVKFEDLAILFVGSKPTTIQGAYVAEITISDVGSMGVGSLVLERIDGGTWLDYTEKYASQMSGWIRRVGYQYSKYRMLVINTQDPASLLCLRNPLIDDDVLTLAVAADKDSTQLNKNTSYVALKEVYRKNIPVILIEDGYVKDLAYFDEDSGLVSGESALKGVITVFAENYQDIIGVVERDKRLNITTHSMSAVISASDLVYRDTDRIFAIQPHLNSVRDSDRDFYSIHLVGFSGREKSIQIDKSFKEYAAGFRDLLNSEAVIKDKTSHYNFYDIYLIYGLKEDPVLPRIESGYRSVARKMPSLSAEAK